jgi:hypothetical protein
MLNIEPTAAAAAHRMVQAAGPDCDNLIRRAALVLAEQGLYALGLFLATRGRDEDRRAAAAIHAAAQALLEQAGIDPVIDDPERLSVDYYKALVTTRDDETPAAALYRILLTQRVLDQALTYAIFYPKTQ